MFLSVDSFLGSGMNKSFLIENIRNCFKKFLIPLYVLIFLTCSCSGKRDPNIPEYEDLPDANLPGDVLAKTHCSGCHGFVNPEFLELRNIPQSMQHLRAGI